jgi:hypothetical protein
MHIDDLKVDFPGIAANIARFRALGVQVHITELDVALPVDSNGNVRNPADLARQAEILSAHCASLLCTNRLHGHPNLGFHRQIFVDSLPLERNQGSRSPFRS